MRDIPAQAREMIGKLNELGELNFKRHKTLPVLSRELNKIEWRAWRDWRIRNGLSVASMDASDRWTVPCMDPPFDIDHAIRDARKGGRNGKGNLRDRLGDPDQPTA